MDMEIPDPSDFLPTSVPRLSSLDNALRCQVCKDLFTTPMITSCSHTFCSLCIRQCLSAAAQCPTCRSKDQSIRLRQNLAMQEAVAAWKAVRGAVLEAVKISTSTPSTATTPKIEGKGEGKRKDEEGGRKRVRRTEGRGRIRGEENTAMTQEMTGRYPKRMRKSRSTLAIPTDQDLGIGLDENISSGTESNHKDIDSSSRHYHLHASDLSPPYDPIDDDDDESLKSPPAATAIAPTPASSSSSAPQATDSLVPCPICSRRMKEELVFSHLDKCPGPSGPTSSTPSTSSTTPYANGKSTSTSTNPKAQFSSPPHAPPSGTIHPLHTLQKTQPPVHPQQHLPYLHYTTLKERDLRRKLDTLGIPTTGTKLHLERRHT